ncbi:MAG: threonine/serine exporter family protein [Clostridiales Family XIII bacterium]|nr:threonine/serine exporter family protein [Clostridiales Family XIII bacterium]
MIDQKQKRILILALFAGELMMKSGAEVYRVEDTITRICHACKIPYVECFATTTGIFLSIDRGDRNGDMHTFIKRIAGTSIDLERISALNEFSRTFTSTDMSVEEGFERLRAIERKRPYGLPLNALGALFIGVTLCPCFGGRVLDSLSCALVTVLAYLFSLCIGRLHLNTFTGTFLCCFVCALLAVAGWELDLVSSVAPVIIGAITLFMPGVAITNAARDLLSGDMLAGVARSAEAFITAVAIAGGVGIALKIWSMARGGFPAETAIRYPLYAFFILAFFTTLGFCFQFHVPRKHWAAASFVGACGFWLYQYGTLLLGYSAPSAGFLSAGLVALLAELCSRAGKDATTLFIIPGIVPLVPGTGMYATMLYMLQSDFSNAAEMGVRSLLIAGCIAIGLISVASLTRMAVAAQKKAAGLFRGKR